MKILVLFLIFVEISRAVVCPDNKYTCNSGNKCCPSGYPWTLYKCCPLDMNCCGWTCCNTNEICCGSATKAGSLCCDPNKSLCCGENKVCYDKTNFKCCATGEVCTKDTTCCNKVIRNRDMNLNQINTQICCSKYTSCCENSFFDYCCPNFTPLYCIPIIIASIVSILIIISCLSSSCRRDNDELIALNSHTIVTPYMTQTYSSNVIDDNIFMPRLKQYETYNDLVNHVIGIANTRFCLSSTIYLFLSLVCLTLSIIGRSSYLIFLAFLCLVVIRLLHFIVCWFCIGCVKSTNIHWISFLFLVIIVIISGYSLIYNLSSVERSTMINTFFPIILLIAPIMFFCSVGYGPILLLNKSGDILRVQVGNCLVGSNDHGSAMSTNVISVDLHISQYVYE